MEEKVQQLEQLFLFRVDGTIELALIEEREAAEEKERLHRSAWFAAVVGVV